jgi:hypothetical protein
MYSDNRLRTYLILTSTLTTLRRMYKDLHVEGGGDFRFKHTWHRNKLSYNWARTVGMWGGVAPMAQIAGVAGVSPGTARMFRLQNSLRASRYATTEQWALARSVFLYFCREMQDDVTPESIYALRMHFGIFQIEAKLYIDEFSRIIDILGIDAEDVVDTSEEQSARIRAAWMEHARVAVVDPAGVPYATAIGDEEA